MQTLINDLLAYSRVDTRGKELEPTDCENVLDLVLNSLQMVIKENNVIITHDPLPKVMADASQLSQLFQNLIGNAIKYRSNKPLKVQIGANHKANKWIFSVSDNGIGIDGDKHDRSDHQCSQHGA